MKCPYCGAQEAGEASWGRYGCDECDYVGSPEEFGAPAAVRVELTRQQAITLQDALKVSLRDMKTRGML